MRQAAAATRPGCAARRAEDSRGTGRSAGRTVQEWRKVKEEPMSDLGDLATPSDNPSAVGATRVSHTDVDEEVGVGGKSKTKLEQSPCFAETVGAMPEV